MMGTWMGSLLQTQQHAISVYGDFKELPANCCLLPISITTPKLKEVKSELPK